MINFERITKGWTNLITKTVLKEFCFFGQKSKYFFKNWWVDSQYANFYLKTVSKLMSLINNCVTTISGHFLQYVLCMFNFHKTEVQTVILMCLTGLNSDWFKSYDTKRKYFHFHFFVILYKIKHLSFLHFCILCHNFCTN